MSLAIYAAPFDNSTIEPMSNDQSDFINQKRLLMHNKTQKATKEGFNTRKVNSVLEKIHNRDSDDDDDDNYFTPPNKPQSVGVSRTIAREEMMTLTNQNSLTPKFIGNAPKPNYSDDNLEVNYYNPSPEMDRKQADDYYKKILPAYLQQNVNTNVNNPYRETNQSLSNNDILIQKMNYMIHLLEENKDEKTNNVTEEVVLYSFLGIFVIFVVDSFARVGKYVR